MSNPRITPGAFDRFPPEMWEEILINMDDVQQLEESAAMSRQVRDVVMNEKFRERYLQARRALQTERGLESWYQDVNGILNGKYELRRVDGSTVAGEYNDGLAEGSWTYTDPAGKVVEFREYQKGMLKKATGFTEELSVSLMRGVHPMDPSRPDPLQNGGRYITLTWDNYPLPPTEAIDYRTMLFWLRDPAHTSLFSGIRTYDSTPLGHLLPTAGDVVFNGTLYYQMRIIRLPFGNIYSRFENGLGVSDTYVFYDLEPKEYPVITKVRYHPRTMGILKATSSVHGRREYTTMTWTPRGRLMSKARYIDGAIVGDSYIRNRVDGSVMDVITYPEDVDYNNPLRMDTFKYTGPSITQLAEGNGISYTEALRLHKDMESHARRVFSLSKRDYVTSLPHRRERIDPVVGLPEDNPTQQRILDNIIYNGGHFGEFPPAGWVRPQFQQ